MRYQIDERVGCIAVLDTDHPTHAERGNGLNPEDENVIFFRFGEFGGGGDGLYIPDSVKREAFAAMKAANESPDMAEALRGLHERYIGLARRLHGAEQFRNRVNDQLGHIASICEEERSGRGDPRYGGF